MQQVYFLLLIIFLFSCSNGQSKKVDTTSTTIQETVPDSLKTASHGMLMDLVVGQPKYNIKTIGILVYDGVNELDFMGPFYVLGQIMGAKTQLIAVEPGSFQTGRGLEIIPHNYIDSVQQLDILVIPGGAKPTVLAAYNTKIQDWIRRIDKNSIYTTSVCTGGWILGATGLLNGKKATTNWYEADAMLSKYGATFVNKRYVNDGKYWTSAGVTAGMDMSLAIMNDLWGERYTQSVMLDMEYDPAPPIEGGSPQKTGFIAYQMMKMMYDANIVPLMDSLDNQKLH